MVDPMNLFDPKIVLYLWFLVPGFVGLWTFISILSYFLPEFRIRWWNISYAEKVVGAAIFSTFTFFIYTQFIESSLIEYFASIYEPSKLFTLMIVSLVLSEVLAVFFSIFSKLVEVIWWDVQLILYIIGTLIKKILGKKVSLSINNFTLLEIKFREIGLIFSVLFNEIKKAINLENTVEVKIKGFNDILKGRIKIVKKDLSELILVQKEENSETVINLKDILYFSRKRDATKEKTISYIKNVHKKYIILNILFLLLFYLRFKARIILIFIVILILYLIWFLKFRKQKS